MSFKRIKYNIFLIGIFFFFCFIFVAFYTIDDKLTSRNGKEELTKENLDKNCPIKDNHKLCLIVPFRDRFDELLQFTPHMKKFLCRQGVKNEILVINQADTLRFNRGTLINIGFLISKHEYNCDYIAMHDVDLLPNNDQLNYMYPENNPFHVSSPELHPKYHYKNFVGGILLLKNEHFEEVNGLSNRFWGWGREDDEFFIRLKKAFLKVQRPVNIETGNKTFKHLHVKLRRPRDYARIGDQIAISKQQDNVTGLGNVSYKEISRNQLLIDGYPAVIVHIKLSCNVYETPWCMDHKQLVDYVKEMKLKMPPDDYKIFIETLHNHKIEIS